MKRVIVFVLIVSLLAVTIAACGRDKEEEPTPAPVSAEEGGLPSSAMDIAADRGLTPDDINAALKTYMPSGTWDEYMMFRVGWTFRQPNCHRRSFHAHP